MSRALAATIFVVFLALPTGISPVIAQTSGTRTSDRVIVTASRLPTTLDDISGSVTVLTREDIDPTQPSSMVDLLRRVPGLHIDKPGSLGGVSSIYLRGADPNFTLVLIDGVKVNDPSNSRGGSFDMSSIDLASVERVEILSGPQSAVHGGDAIAGVINIVTRSGGEEMEYSLVASGARFGAHSSSAQTRGPIADRGHFAISSAYIDDGQLIEGSGYINRVLTAKVELAPSDNSLLQISGRLSDSDSSNFPDDSGGPLFADRRTSDDRDALEASAGLQFEQELDPVWDYTLESNFYRRREVFSSPGVAGSALNPGGVPINSSESLYERSDARLSNRFRLGASTEAVMGADMSYENGASDSRLIFGGSPTDSRFELDRTVVGLFAEGRITPDPAWTFHGSLRVDNPEGFSSEGSPSVGVIYRLAATGTTLKATWGEGFKLPSFFALGNAIVGDPTLLPEEGSSIEGSVVQSLDDGRIELGITLFRNRFRNVIDFDDDAFVLVNRPLVVTWGSEVTAGWQATDRLRFNGHVTFTDHDIRDTEEELRNRPKWRAAANGTWQLSNAVTLDGSLLYVGRVLDSSVPTGARNLDDYVRADTALTWRVSPGWQVSAAVDNVFDTNYEEAVGFQGPGVTPRLAVRIKF